VTTSIRERVVPQNGTQFGVPFHSPTSRRHRSRASNVLKPGCCPLTTSCDLALGAQQPPAPVFDPVHEETTQLKGANPPTLPEFRRPRDRTWTASHDPAQSDRRPRATCPSGAACRALQPSRPTAGYPVADFAAAEHHTTVDLVTILEAAALVIEARGLGGSTRSKPPARHRGFKPATGRQCHPLSDGLAERGLLPRVRARPRA
jgi:hypothetical protein